jgi:hypothetical protein
VRRLTEVIIPYREAAILKPKAKLHRQSQFTPAGQVRSSLSVSLLLGCRFIRPKSLKKFREAIKPFTRRTNGHGMSAIAQKLRPRLQGFYNYFKHASASALEDADRWIRVGLRSMLRKRAGRRGKGRGADHQRWPNSYFVGLGVFNLEEARKLDLKSLRAAVNF